ncbi:MAG: hypothetical protein WKF57_12935 [Nakamurella sp.]
MTAAAAHLELLIVPGCPHELDAAAAFQHALLAAGLSDATFDIVLIDSPQQAEERGFAGSPSFHLDGHDILPDAGAPNALACRLYRSASGTLTGVPDSETLAAAILRT